MTTTDTVRVLYRWNTKGERLYYTGVKDGKAVTSKNRGKAVKFYYWKYASHIQLNVFSMCDFNVEFLD